MNSRLVDSDKGIFEVLGTVLVRISSPYWTQSLDVNEEECRGTIFRFVDTESDEDRAIASIKIADVSRDTSEPNVSLLSEGDVAALDKKMQGFIEAGLSTKGMRLVRWMSSKLNKTDHLSGLVTPFIVEDDGRQRQFIELRFSVDSKKMVVQGTFDIDRSKELAAPIFGTIQNIRIL